VIDGMLLEFRRGPGKHNDVVTGASADFRRRGFVDFLQRNVVQCDFGFMLLAPFLGHFLKPSVEARNKVSPLGDSESFLAKESAGRKRKKRAESGSGESQF